MRALLIAYCLIATNLVTFGQRNEDSLLTVWHDESRHVEDRVNAFRQIVWDKLFSDPDSALLLAHELRKFSKKNSYPYGENLGYSFIGSALSFMGKNYEALKYYRLGYEVSKSAGIKEGMAGHLAAQGRVFGLEGDAKKKLEYTRGALKLYEEIQDTLEIVTVVSSIAMMYNYADEPELALEYLRRAKSLNDIIQDERLSYYIPRDFGTIYMAQNNLDSAEYYFRQGLQVAEKLDDANGIAMGLRNLGWLNWEKGDLEAAREYYQESLTVATEAGLSGMLALRYINIGRLNGELGEYEKAIASCLDGLEIAKQAGRLLDLKLSYDCLYENFRAVGNTERALQFLEQYNEVDDSLDAKDASKALQQMEFEKQQLADSLMHASEIKLKSKEVQREKTVRNGFMGGFVLVAVFAVVFFFQRKRISREKERSEELLLNILPEEVAEELKEKGEADAKLIDHVTVLFTDFKGFTAMSEQLLPRELVKDLNDCFSAFDRITDKYGIEKIKTIGDAYMAAGGLPTPNTTHATDVIKAALEMSDFVEQVKKKKIEQELPYFEIRIGVHTGPVVAGIVGVKKFQYDIWGDTVNTASRMESSGEVGQVNISQTTYELLKDSTEFKFTPRGKVQAKGKGELEMYFVSKSDHV